MALPRRSCRVLPLLAPRVWGHIAGIVRIVKAESILHLGANLGAHHIDVGLQDIATAADLNYIIKSKGLSMQHKLKTEKSVPEI